MEAIDPKPGTRASYEQIEQITDNPVGSTRFRTVADAWRRRMFRERGLQSMAQGGEIVFLTADEAHKRGIKGLTAVGRAAGRLKVRVDSVDAKELSPSNVDAHMLLRREANALVMAARNSVKTIAKPNPIVDIRAAR